MGFACPERTPEAPSRRETRFGGITSVHSVQVAYFVLLLENGERLAFARRSPSKELAALCHSTAERGNMHIWLEKRLGVTQVGGFSGSERRRNPPLNLKNNSTVPLQLISLPTPRRARGSREYYPGSAVGQSRSGVCQPAAAARRSRLPERPRRVGRRWPSGPGSRSG